MSRVESRPDGRRLRAERNEDAVIDALLDLYRAGQITPSAAEIARRAAVSERTVFRLFADLEALAAATIERQIARVAPLLAVPDTSGSLDERVQAVVHGRLRVYREVAPVFRVGQMHALRSSAVRAGFERRWQRSRALLERQFRPELDALPAADRAGLVAVLDTTLSLEALDYLHRAHSLDEEAMRAALARTLRALFRDALAAAKTDTVPSQPEE